MARTILWVSWLFAYLLTRLPLYWKVKRLDKQGREAEKQVIVKREVKKWSERLLRHIGVRLTVQGAENLPGPDEAVVFAANHQSFVDIPVLLYGLDEPYALLARREIGKVPLLRGWMNMLGCVYVQREDMRAAAAALKESEEWLAGGHSLIIFPEGTRARSDTMGEFKAGAVRMALKAKVRIVPVAVDGTYKALEGNGNRLTPADVRLVILPPVETAGLSKEEQRALPAKLEEMIRAAKDAR